MELNNNNYFSQEAGMEYMSASQFKDFQDCEVKALAKVKGEYVEEKSKELLVGGYVDAYFSNELEQYKELNPQIFKKDGTLLKDFEKANDIINAIEEDNLMRKYLSGENQIIFTGEIEGVKFKGKLDSLFKDEIVDLKVVASIREPVWVERNGKNIKTDFIDAYGYDIQGAIYQELVKQSGLGKLPFTIAAVSKEEESDKALIQIDQEFLDKQLQVVKTLAPRYDLIKRGLIEPIGCGNCPVCRKLRRIDRVISYKELFNKGDVENDN